jgi:peptidoglycan/xylan/chitin deacetylase (PgdA/CDA1 family)
MTRREWIGTALGGAAPLRAQAGAALISITFDCEMSAHYPVRGQTEWNYKKGDLDDATKEYAVGAARRVAAAGGKMHFFVVGRVFEQPSVAWLEEIVKLGQPVGNHTYDHVNVTATQIDQIQYRFQRAPWLTTGKSPAQLIDENIRMCTAAMKDRLGIKPNGFRTPGGFPEGLKHRPDLQNLLLSHGYTWISSMYPRHALKPDTGAAQPGELDAILAKQDAAQPFKYASGLLELPMNPPSDVGTMRTGRWTLSDFRKGVEMGLNWCIERGKVWDFLAHPSALGVADPNFEIIDMIIDTTKRAGSRARLVGLDTVARTFGAEA